MKDSFWRKTCPQCGRELALDRYYPDKRTPTGVASWCKECTKAAVRENYRRGGSAVKNRKKLARRKERKLTAIRLLGGKCQRCGYDEFISGFDFHHVGSGDQIRRIANLLNVGDMAAVEEELDHCALLCACCHNGYHSGEWEGEFVKHEPLGWTLSEGS